MNTKAYRSVRNSWAALTVVPILIGLVLLSKGFELWNQQIVDSAQTESVDWKTGFGGFALNFLGFMSFLGAIKCVWMARSMHLKVRASESFGRLKTRPRHPTAIRASSRVGSS